MFKRWWHYLLAAAISAAGLVAAIAALTAIMIYPQLPSLDSLTDYRPKIPLRIFTADGKLLGEFGEERRALTKIQDVPDVMKQAILAAEDERFYQHGGVDYMGILRAALANLSSGGAKEGASTITMQVARNFFLSREKTMTRKVSEMLLSLKIEKNLTKDQILELYINQIYLGERAYGFAAAAQTYFGKPLQNISVAEAAMLAGLPKAPSRYNPVANPKRAQLRQHYVLRRMLEVRAITPEQYQAALQEPLKVMHSATHYDVNADYVAEMVRQYMYDRYQDAAYTSGFRVYTTLRSKDQNAAVAAVDKGILDFERRHAYRGPEGFLQLPDDAGLARDKMDEALDNLPELGRLIPAVVTSAGPKQVTAYIGQDKQISLPADSIKYIQRFLDNKTAEDRRIRRGSLIRLAQNSKHEWQVLQLPEVEAAFLSVNPMNGAIYSLVGGFDFNRNKYNHVTQAWRQPGSSFKPFIYSAALDKGFTAASIINDAPLVIDPAETGNKQWEPKNFDGKFDGPIRMRKALTKSKNLVSIRILQAITPAYAQEYAARFGFDPARQPPYLTMALGAGSVTPYQMAAAYSTFANGGYRVYPFFIDRITDARGHIIAAAKPQTAGAGAKQIIDPRNAYIMTSMMQDVIRHGTAMKALSLGRDDIAGKTGTTNDQFDAWFCGFQPRKVVGIAWMGYDQPRSLGGSETGGHAALPIWIDYMDKTIKNSPPSQLPLPDGVVTVNIDPTTGTRSSGGDAVPEYFYQEAQPPEAGQAASAPATEETVQDQIF